MDGAGVGGRTRLDNSTGLDALQVTEACAQSLAVILGQALRERGGPAASGMLVGLKQARLIRRLRPGERLEVSAQRSYELGAFHLYQVAVTDDAGALVFSGEYKTVSQAVAQDGQELPA